MMDGSTLTDEWNAVFAVSNGPKSWRTCGLVKSVQKHRSLELEVQEFSRSFRPSFPRIVFSRHLAAAIFASLEDPF